MEYVFEGGFEKLEEKIKQEYEAKSVIVQQQIMDAISQIKQIERQSDKKVSEWQSNVALLTVNAHINYIKSKYKRNKKINQFLNDVKQDVLKNVSYFFNNKKPNGIMAFAEALLGRDILSYEEILLSDSFRYYDPKREERICRLIENGIMLESSEDMNNMDIVETIGNVFICRSPTGYYACTNDKFYMASEIFADLETLKMSGVIDLMNNVYEANSYKKEEIENE